MKKLRWKNADIWREKDREPMIINGIVEGFVKEYDNLKMFWIYRAGHMVKQFFIEMADFVDTAIFYSKNICNRLAK